MRAGDLNDTPDSETLRPLLKGIDLTDIGTHPAFDWGRVRARTGVARSRSTTCSCRPLPWERVRGGGAFRKGIRHGPRTKNLWPMYDTLTSKVHQASDRAAIRADIDL